MDVRFFLTKRIAFIRQLYAVASAPYVERKRKIETGEEPFVPPYSGGSEPPFLEEWLEADESLHVLAYSCISMLAASLHLYLKAWEREMWTPCRRVTQEVGIQEKRLAKRLYGSFFQPTVH